MNKISGSNGVRNLISKLEGQNSASSHSNKKSESGINKIASIKNEQAYLVSQKNKSSTLQQSNMLSTPLAKNAMRKEVNHGDVKQPSSKGTGSIQKTAPKETAVFKNGIPKEIHFAWEGKNIPEDAMANILLNAKLAPDFNVNIWTTKPSLIFSTLDKMANSENNAAHRFLAQKFGPLLSVNDTKELYTDLSKKLDNTEGLAEVRDGEYLSTMFYREINGAYQNFAAASDITRAALMFLKGGCYMDVDVVCHSLHELEQNNIPNGYLIGSSKDKRSLPNALLISLPASNLSKDILEQMAYEMLSLEHADPSDNNNEPDMTLWVKKRSVKKDRQFQTMALTGPDLFYSMRLQKKAGIFFDADVSTRINEKQSSPNLAEKKVNDILFANFRKGFNDDGDWASLKSVKGKPAATI